MNRSRRGGAGRPRHIGRFASEIPRFEPMGGIGEKGPTL